MPKFYVYGGYDAYAVQRAIVEADTVAEARKLVDDGNVELDWEDMNETTVFDDFTVFTEEGSIVPVEGVDAEENSPDRLKDHMMTMRERDAVLVGLQLLRGAIIAGGLPDPMLQDTFTNGDVHTGLTLEQIEALSDRLNV